ncbi:uncharacterized protein [Primulina eburnea]|uniref:uncharacterized protein isoform X1 n=1 Tax=Primulina eburnea TaxID=1245227 RepID=UPI003C6C8B6D
MKPNRSEVRLSGEAAAQVEAATRDYFDRLAPKRPTKPQRSEHDTNHADASFSSSVNDSIPELLQFQLLEEDTQKLPVYCDNKADDEEFTETEYYRDLNCVDKNHHTTGTGFIKADDTKGKCFSLTPNSSVAEHHDSCRGNPATNDWIPAKGDTVSFISGKPNRSE